MSCVLWFLCSVAVVAVVAAVTDEEYYSMPRMFELDDYDECLGSRGAFCLGSFYLTSKKYNRLLDVMQRVSKAKYTFNHTVISRGFCVTSTCAHIAGEHLPNIFEDCVQNLTKTRYKLDARLLKLEYCKTNESPPKTPVDVYDLIFAYITGLILICNVVGTAYEMFRNKDEKPNRHLIAWSLINNWRRLTAYHDKEESKLDALNPIHGMKAITLMAVILAHSVLAYHMTYLHNPRFLENNNVHPLSSILNNGTAVVQTFIILSAFLMTYNVLIALESEPERKLDFRYWLQLIAYRIIRIAPLNIFVIGFSATWWRFASAGPLWQTLVEAESERCRQKWWTHALFVNNLVMPDNKCLIQSWFLAVDMQLYVLTSILLVFLARRPHTAIKVLAGLFVLAIVANYFLAYYLDLKSMLFISHPKYTRTLYEGLSSFKWEYAAAWSSAPAALLGLLLAFLYQWMRQTDYRLQESTVFCVLYRISVPGIFAWFLAGYIIRDTESRLVVALYTAIYRPVFTIIMAIAMIGFFYKIDHIYWKILSWRIWQIFGRMSLSVLLVHWWYNLIFLAIKTNMARASVYEIGGHLYAAIFMTYITSLPLHLMIELPVQKFFQGLLFS